MKIRKCKGMRDLSPREMEQFRAVENTCRDILTAWGYREVRTPTLEHLHLFTSAGTLTPAQLGKVYSFLDWDGWSGERVVLRPDGTIPVARYYTETSPGEPARLFYSTNVFMFEDGSDKARERWQCGGELIGIGSPAADAELIRISLDILDAFDFSNITVRLSHAGVIKALLEKLGLNPEEEHRLFDRILDGDATALAEIGRNAPDLKQALETLVYLKGRSRAFLENQQAALPASLADLKPCLEDFSKSVEVLDELGIGYEINIASGAGFEYYTGMIFQFFEGDRKVGGGGRYDALISSMGGGNVPAAGFALYLTALLDIMKDRESGTAAPKKVIVRGNDVPAVFRAGRELRGAGYAVEQGRSADTVAPVVEPVAAGFSVTIEGKSEKFGSLAEVLARLEALWPSR